MSEIKEITWPGWETVQLIGRGSFGAVYEIQREIFGDIEKAALKVITIPQNSSDIEELYSDGYDEESITNTFQSHLRNIVAEYSLMRKMNGSANVVNCDDVRYIQHDDGIGWDIFIKMELLTPLIKALPSEITEELVIKIAKDMCGALELCKKYEIVHRDIKPQNIFVSPNGDYKLGDFGIAKTVEKTMGGTKIGTYKYMAPEVYNNQPYGSGADIYSLGLVLYWLLNERRMPFLPLPPEKLKAGMDELARNRRLSGDPIPAPAHGSEGLKQIILKACAYDVKDRYASAAELLADLNRLEGGDEVITHKGQINEYPVEEEETVSIYQTGIGLKNAEPMESVKVEELTVGPVAEQDSKPEMVEVEGEGDGTVCLFGYDGVVDEKKAVEPTEAEKPLKKEGLETAQKVEESEEKIMVAAEVATKNIAPQTQTKVEKEQKDEFDNYPKKGYNKRILWGIGGALVALVVVFICVFGGMNKGNKKTTNPVQSSVVSATERPVETPVPVATKEPVTTKKPVETKKPVSTTAPTATPTVAPTATPIPTPITIKAPIIDIAANFDGVAALYEDGTVYVDCWQKEYEYKKAEEWRDIVSICAGDMHLVGLDKNGKVYVTGWNDYGEGDVDEWTDIIAISAGREFTLGLKANGTVVIAGQHPFGVSDLKDVVSISASKFTAEFLTKDGTWIARGGDKSFVVNVSDLGNILSVQNNYSFGVKKDGKVVGVNLSGNVVEMPWENVKEVVAESERVIVLYNDGNVVAYNVGWGILDVEYNKYGECNVSGWRDIVSIAGHGLYIDGYTVGLKSDGTVVVTGMYCENRVCDVSALNKRITKTIIPKAN